MDSEAPRNPWPWFRGRTSFSSLSLSGQVPPPLSQIPTVCTWIFSKFLLSQWGFCSLVTTALYFRADPPWVRLEKLLELLQLQSKVPPLALPAQFIVIPAPAPACCGFMWPALEQECDFITEIMFVYFCRCPWDLNLKRVLSIIVIKATKHVLGADTKGEFSKHRKALK